LDLAVGGQSVFSFKLQNSNGQLWTAAWLSWMRKMSSVLIAISLLLASGIATQSVETRNTEIDPQRASVCLGLTHTIFATNFLPNIESITEYKETDLKEWALGQILENCYHSLPEDQINRMIAGQHPDIESEDIRKLYKFDPDVFMQPNFSIQMTDFQNGILKAIEKHIENMKFDPIDINPLASVEHFES
jgi:hypothetical protein